MAFSDFKGHFQGLWPLRSYIFFLRKWTPRPRKPPISRIGHQNRPKNGWKRIVGQNRWFQTSVEWIAHFGWIHGLIKKIHTPLRLRISVSRRKMRLRLCNSDWDHIISLQYCVYCMHNAYMYGFVQINKILCTDLLKFCVPTVHCPMWDLYRFWKKSW